MSFIAHPWLRRKSYRSRLLRVARALSRSGNLDRVGEARAFRAFHATGFAIQERLARGLDPKDKKIVELVDMHDRLCDVLFRANLGLVYDMKRRTMKAYCDDADATSEGYLALLRAVRSFDPWMGFRFSTYACRSIIRAFHALQTRERRNARLMKKNIERAAAAGMPDSTPPPRPENGVLDRLSRIITENRADLTSAEQLIITQRVLRGEGGRPATLEAVGKMLSLSKERVRQLQIVALAKLREALQGDQARERTVASQAQPPERVPGLTALVPAGTLAMRLKWNERAAHHAA